MTYLALFSEIYLILPQRKQKQPQSDLTESIAYGHCKEREKCQKILISIFDVLFLIASPCKKIRKNKVTCSLYSEYSDL
jgi:hypothetical protein